MKAVDMDTMSWECIAADGTKLRSAVKQHLRTGEDVISATKTVTTSTSEREINKIRNKQNTLGLRYTLYHSLSSLIDGGLYLSISLENLLNFEDMRTAVNMLLLY